MTRAADLRARFLASHTALPAEPTPGILVVTARAENHLDGVNDLDDTIGSLSAWAANGALVSAANELLRAGTSTYSSGTLSSTIRDRTFA